MKPIALAVCALLASSAVRADRPGPDSDNSGRGTRSNITVPVAGLLCTTAAGAGAFTARTWSWGASNSGSSSGGGGGGAGRTEFQSFAITKAFDGCSPALLGAVSTGRRFPTLTLTQTDALGNLVARVDLDGVAVSAWNVGGTTREGTPDETAAFVFSRVRISSGGASFCYDVGMQRSC
jgi:type VI protein secretion system component Hcp